MRNIGITLFVIFSFIFILVGCGKERGSSPLVVGMELQYPPFEMSDTSGKPTGFSVDMAYDLGRFLGREVEIYNTAWVGLIPALQTGKVDVVISSMSITPEREEVINFSDPYVYSGLALLIHEKSAVQSYRDLQDSDVKVAVKVGTIGETVARKLLDSSQIEVFQQVSVAVLEVSQGRVDAFLYDPLTVFENQKNHPDTTRYNLEAIPGSYGAWGVAVKEGNKYLLDQVNEFIALYRESGGFDRLSDTYLKEISDAFEKQNVPFFFEPDLGQFE